MARGGTAGRRVFGWLVAACFLVLAALLGAADASPASAAPAVRPAVLDQPFSFGRAPGIPATSSRAAPCGTTPGLVCSQVVVPLDRTGQVPGSIALHVEVVPALGTPRGAIFLIAGGPGQGSAHVFGLDSEQAVSLYRYLFPGYTLVAYDDRGTGDSGLLDCPGVQTAITADQQRSAAASCAGTIGPTRAFYSTAEHAEDLDAVRQALGFDKIALYGVSYGTKLAMAYTLAHPTHVERLVLDSVLPPELPDPYSANVLRDLPAILDAFCSNGGCRAATGNFTGDLVALANRLAAKPIQGNVILANGKKVSKRVDGLSLLSTLLDADLNPGLAAELPAVVHAARGGNTQPLLRLVYLHDLGQATPSVDLSFALYAATVCRDGPFPWSPDTPIAERQGILNAAVAALPAGTFGPFGTWAARFGNADFCVGWPSPSGGAALAAGPLPDVPMLAVSGGFDMRTPTDGARAVVARFPHGQLLVVPGVGHSTVTADPSGCAIQSVRTWMTGGPIPAQCPRSAPFLSPIPALPSAASPKGTRTAAATYAIAAKTISEAEAAWLMASEPVIPGIFGGKLTTAQRGLTLTRYTVAPGVTLTGNLRLTSTSLPLRFQGTLTVAGASAANGILGLNGTSLRGTLGGRLVGR
ncbi:MAG TPA: alpha/beta fold hydrolase [Gaiellaceae bacterium]